MDLKVTKQPDGSWIAIDADNYDVESDSVGAWSNSPAGYGRTRDEAIQELMEAIKDQANAST